MKPANGKTQKFKILLVDDHPLLREGLASLIDVQEDLAVCGQAGNLEQALVEIADKKPDLVIVDITFPGGNGIDLIKDMDRRELRARVLVLSMHDEFLYAERALRAGAKGYIMKHEPPLQVLKAIRQVLSGEIYVSEKMSLRMIHKIADHQSPSKALFSEIEVLSDRELEVFQLIGQGRGTRQIAETLHVSIKTVEAYRAHIKAKLNLKNALELAQRAILWVENNHLN